MQCEACDTKITFWTWQKQLIPLRFRCPECQTGYRVTAPGISMMYAGVIGVTLCMAVVWGVGWDLFGLLFAIPFIAFILGVGYGVEVLLYTYVSAKGTFTRRDVDEAQDDSEGESSEETED